MVLSLKPGHREHLTMCMLSTAVGAVLLALGALLLAQKTPQPQCGSVEGQVGIAASEASNADMTLIALGVPIVISGVFLIWWGLRGNLAALQQKRDASAQPKPFVKQALIAFSVAALGLWVSAFISFIAAPVLKELCGNFHCSASRDAKIADGVGCFDTQADLFRICAESDVCCGCKESWHGGEKPRLICQETQAWACETETLQTIISYIVFFFALLLTSAALFFYMVIRGRLQGCIDLGDSSCEASLEADTPTAADQSFGPSIEDECSPSVSPSSRSVGPKAIENGPLSPCSTVRREVSTGTAKEPTLVVVNTQC